MNISIRDRDDLVRSLKGFLPFEVVNPNPSNKVEKLLSYGQDSDVPAGSNVFYTNKIYFANNVGIGNANPTYTLDVTGDINFSGNLYQGGVLFSGGGGGDASISTIFFLMGA